MVLLKLYWSFLLIGFSSFGGLSMIPLISSEMVSNGWMTVSQVTDIVAIAEMTPGPLGLNCATFAGMQAAGIPGAIAANLGTLAPTYTLCAVAAAFFFRFKESLFVRRMLVGVRPACLGMVLGVLVSLSLSSYFPQASLNLPAMVIGVTDLVLLMKYKVGIPKIILFSAGMGIVLFGVLGLGGIHFG
ncbi:MAG: chromate transporter [Oscillospiraceae bacterium]|jgi:chromate transporter|nr:chromate transporter [Oscillospiraceae bacterium]